MVSLCCSILAASNPKKWTNKIERLSGIPQFCPKLLLVCIRNLHIFFVWRKASNGASSVDKYSGAPWASILCIWQLWGGMGESTFQVMAQLLFLNIAFSPDKWRKMEEGDWHIIIICMPTKSTSFKWLPSGSWPQKSAIKDNQINKARAWAVRRQIIYPFDPGSCT